MKQSVAVLALLASLPMNLFAIDGHAVTIAYRYCWACPNVPESNIPGADRDFPTGAIIRADVKGDAVVKTDTIVSISTAVCTYAAMSLDGSRVAFYRWPYKSVNNKLTLVGTAGQITISIVDISGKNLKDLVTVAGYPGYATALDWPADGWVYYVKPNGTGDITSRCGNEIWKVNAYAANPASTNVKVGSLAATAYIRRFSLNQAATRFAMQTYALPGQSGGNFNGAGAWPSSGGSISPNIGDYGGCNAKIDASGNWGGNYGGGSHDRIQIQVWNGSKFVTHPTYTWLSGPNNIWDAMTWTGWSMGTQCGCEMMGFAANSDKWVCQNVYWNYSGPTMGTNQLVMDFIDKKAFWGTRNPVAPTDAPGHVPDGTASWNAHSGDFWVQPPAGKDYAYEDTLGTWAQMTKPAGWTLGDGGVTQSIAYRAAAPHGQLTARIDANGILNVRLPDAESRCRVSVIDMSGRTIASQPAVGSFSMRIAGPRGAYLVRVSDGKNVLTTQTVPAL